MEPMNKTTSPPTRLNCFNQRVSSDFKNQTSSTHAFVGDGLYVFGLIGIFIILKTLMTLMTMLENKPDDHSFMIFDGSGAQHDTTLVRKMAKAVERLECSTPLPVSTPSSCETFSMFANSPPPRSGNGSYAVYSAMEGNQCNQATSTPISRPEMRTIFSSPDSSINSLV